MGFVPYTLDLFDPISGLAFDFVEGEVLGPVLRPPDTEVSGGGGAEGGNGGPPPPDPDPGTGGNGGDPLDPNPGTGGNGGDPFDPGSSTPAEIPEPSTVLLFASGALLLACHHRNRHRHAPRQIRQLPRQVNLPPSLAPALERIVSQHLPQGTNVLGTLRGPTGMSEMSPPGAPGSVPLRSPFLSISSRRIAPQLPPAHLHLANPFKTQEKAEPRRRVRVTSGCPCAPSQAFHVRHRP